MIEEYVMLETTPDLWWEYRQYLRAVRIDNMLTSEECDAWAEVYCATPIGTIRDNMKNA